MNQQSPAGSAGIQISAKRKRGRPRKEDVPAPPEKLTPHRAPTLNIGPSNAPQFASGAPFHPQPQPSASASSNGNNTDDLQIGQAVTGVLEGTFDAGYLLSVQVGEGRPPLRGLVFKPGKFVPVTSENDVAPSVKMHQRMSFSEPLMNPVAPAIKTEAEQTVDAEPSHVPVVCESSVAQDVVKEVCKEQDEKVVEDSMECEGQGSSERKEAETGNGRYEGGNTGPKLELSLCSSFETPVVAVEQPEAGEKEKTITVEIQQVNHQEQQLPGVFMDVGQAQETSLEGVLQGEHVDAGIPFSGTANAEEPKMDATTPFSGTANVGEPGAEEAKMDETTGLLDAISPESIQLPEGVLTASAEPVPPPETVGADLVEPVLPPQATLPDPVPPPPESDEVTSPELALEPEGGQVASAKEITAEPVEEKGPEEPVSMVGGI